MLDSLTKERLTRLELFRALTKDGCTWRGDIVSLKWAEELFFEPEFIEAKVLETLERYPRESYKLFAGRVLIA